MSHDQKLENGCVLLNLPDTFLYPCLGEWLLLSDFCRLDTSVCARYIRSSFLEKLKKYKLTCGEVKLPQNGTIHQLQYIARRGLCVLKFVVHDWDPYILWNSNNSVFLSKVKVVELKQTYRQNEIVGLCCNTVETLRFSGHRISASVDNDTIAGLLGKCKLVTEVQMSHAYDLTPKSLIEIANQCPQLKHLKIWGHKLINYDALLHVSKTCKLLLTLHVTRDTDIYVTKPKEPTSPLTGACIAKVLPNLRNLTDINVSKCREVTDDFAEQLARYCPNLTTFTVNHTEITCLGINILISTCRQLRDVCLSSINNTLESSLFVDLVIASSEIRKLHLLCCDLNDTGLQNLLQVSPDLTYLDLGYCSGKITAQCLRFISENCRNLVHCNIQHVNGSLSGATHYNPAEINDYSPHLVPLVHANPRLETLTLCATNKEMLLQIASKECQSLAELDVSQCRGAVDDSVVAALSQACRSLVTLNIDGSEDITDASLQALAANCTQLQKLSLHECNKLTRMGLARLMLHCVTLKEVSQGNYSYDSKWD